MIFFAKSGAITKLRSVLPTVTKSDIHNIQMACNSGLRAVWGAPKYGYIDVIGIRKHLNIPSVEMITILEEIILCAFAHCIISSESVKF